jgi:hypothetical protein
MRFTEGMTDQIRIRVAREERRRLVVCAQEQGLSLSEFLRRSGVGGALTAMSQSIAKRETAKCQ